MGPKAFLVLMTIVAVVTDSMLHPFYPQYFEQVFGVADPMHVGFYIGACSLTVMLAFPLWALLARKIPVLRLLIATQLATGALSLACCAITSLEWFWAVSLGMMVFKASYLLIYPYVMSLESKEYHVGTISLLALVVYFGNILAALLSGVLFELADARYLFVVMACGDAVQIGLCFMLMKSPLPSPDDGPAEADPSEPMPARPRLFAYRLGSVMLVMYFSAYLTEPFFSAYWEDLSAIENKIVTGLVFAIPGLAALLGLYLNSRKRSEDSAPYAGILPAIMVGICSLWLQASGSPSLLLIGRFLYGLALFQSMVRLDALLFRFSTPETYSVDFSKINIFQALGIQIASLAAGSIVAALGMKTTFLMSMGGFMLGALLYGGLFRGELRRRLSLPPADQSNAPAGRIIAPEPNAVGAQEAIT
jgi:MFS transporter, DHA1 family, multidrug resistance protein